MIDFHNFDLNLLTAFDALMAERNVTLAARRVGVGQPAMSYSLARLRELFADPLFLRSAGTMQPTARALDLAGPIARVLAEIRETILIERSFDPAIESRIFRIGCPDQIEVAVLPSVLRDLRDSAPQARIAVSHVDRDMVSPMLERGAIDLAIGFFPDPTIAEKREVLFHEEFVCLFDSAASGVSSPIGLDAYLELPHLLMSPRSEMAGIIDEVLSRKGQERRVLMSTPHFLAIPFLLRGFRAIAAVPRRLAEHCVNVAPLAISPLPIQVDGYDVSMLWHVRSDADPTQRWFRDIVRKTKTHSG